MREAPSKGAMVRIIFQYLSCELGRFYRHSRDSRSRGSVVRHDFELGVEVEEQVDETANPIS